jgi:hypothetical protein
LHVGYTGFGKPLTAFQKAFEEDYHSDFSFLLTALLLCQIKAMLSKFAIIKELAEQRTDRRLQKMSPDYLFDNPSK